MTNGLYHELGFFAVFLGYYLFARFFILITELGLKWQRWQQKTKAKEDN